MHKKGHNWIGPIKHGALHKELHIALGHHISLAELHKAGAAAKKRGDTKEEKRVVFAENARKWHHGKKK